jgi:predicted transcriptional regulator
LETLQQRKAVKRSAAPPPLDLLTLLASGPRKVSELQKESGLEFSEFAEALTNLRNADLVVVSGPAGDELAALTPTGEGVAAMKS